MDNHGKNIELIGIRWKMNYYTFSASLDFDHVEKVTNQASYMDYITCHEHEN